MVFYEFPVKWWIPGWQIAYLLFCEDEGMYVVSDFLGECMLEFRDGQLEFLVIKIYENPEIQVALVGIGTPSPRPIEANTPCLFKRGKMLIHQEHVHASFQFGADRGQYPGDRPPFPLTQPVVYQYPEVS